jgi:hypothetical protein
MTSYDKLKDVALAWKEWISKSNVIPKDAGVKDAKMKAMEGIEAMSSRVVKGEDPAEATAWWFPNVLSGEVSAAQPVLFCLLDLIGGCLKDCDAPHNQSPFKTRAKRNQIIPPSAFRKKRIADFGVLKPGCFQLVMPDYAIKLFIEMKPVLRRSAGPDALDEESLQQAIGHLSKYLMQSLNFHGNGVPSFATGLTATLTHVNVVQLTLDLKEISAEEDHMTNLRLFVSTRLPLMTRESFNQWMKKAYPNEEPKGITRLRQSLYGENGDKGLDKAGIPLGLRLFWELMHKRHNELFGPDYNTLVREGQNNGMEIDVLLGSGSFSVVFGLRETNHILKLPRYHFLKHVEKEKLILAKLGRNRDRANEIENVALPVLESIRDVQFILGNVKTVAKGLEMSPKGIPMVGYLQQEDNINSSELVVKTLENIGGALNYMHEKGIAHNDVTPYNLVVTGEGEAASVMLVDFGCACCLTENLAGFVGTPLFVHKDIFWKYPGKEWTPQKKYDFFSLALTLCALLKGGRAPWDADGFPCTIRDKMKEKLNEKMNERRRIAAEVINEGPLDDWYKQQLESLIGTSTSSLPVKRKSTSM